MMNKVRRKFVLYATLAVFVLLTVLLSIINGINFTMAGDDADEITRMIAGGNGGFNMQLDQTPPEAVTDLNASGAAPAENTDGAQGTFRGKPARFGPMGPASPEVNASVRYFTCSFDDAGNGEVVAYHISAVTEAEALAWAQGLVKEGTGWTRGTYRYRVYTQKEQTLVTVIDQGRELLPSYRILIISVIGELLGLFGSFLALVLVGKHLFKPLEDADRRQKRFIAEAEKEFKIPLTVINANTEIIERETGATDYTKSINRQVKKMTALVRTIGSLAIFDRADMQTSDVELSGMLSAAVSAAAPKFAEKNIAPTLDADGEIHIQGDSEMIRQMLAELIDNALKFSLTRAAFSLKRAHDRVYLTASNDAALPDGGAEQVFDRFVTLRNAENTEGAGLGLAFVKDAAQALGGRVGAKVADGVFTIQIDL